MSDWDFPKRQQTFNPAGTKFEQVFKDQIALIAYAQYRRKHIVSKRENEWLPHFALTFSELVRKVGRQGISLDVVVKFWETVWLQHPRGYMPSTTNWRKIIKPIMPFIRGELILAFTTDEKTGNFFLVTRTDRVIFHLAKSLPDVEQPQSGSFYEDFKAGIKTSEWRDLTLYWAKRLFSGAHWDAESSDKQDLTQFLKVHRAWFVEGYPKGNLPRLEADITGVFYHPLSFQLEIQIANVKEVKQA